MSVMAPEPLTAGELLTPTGAIAGAWEPHTPEWYATRSRGIGSSDIPAILGYSPYRSAGHVWAEKRGELPHDEGGEAAVWGTLLEPVIAARWADLHGTALAEVPTLRHTEHAHWIASLDRLVLDGCELGGRCGLEIKAHSEWKAGSWREDVPDAVLAQTQWQLLVTGLDHLHVAALIGGQRLVEHLVTPDPALLTYIAAAADGLWAAVLSGERPAVDSAELLLDLLDRLFPNREGVLDVPAGLAAQLRADYAEAAATERAGKTAKTAAKASAALLLGPYQELSVEGRIVATYKPDLRQAVDTDRLKAEFPDAHAACVTKNPTVPILRWKKASS